MGAVDLDTMVEADLKFKTDTHLCVRCFEP